MSRMIDPQADMGSVGGILGFDVKTYREEDDPHWLALRLAEAINDSVVYQNTADAFRTNLLAERQKAMNLQHVIFELEQRKRTGVVTTSRMDPYNTYDLDECKVQLSIVKERANQFNEEANQAIVKAEEARRKANRYQRLIREAQKKDR